MANLLALCRPPNGPLHVKRVKIAQTVQDTLVGLFQQQATEFLSGVEEEVPFGGDYKPDTDELLVLNAPDEIGLMQAALADVIGLETIDAENFAGEHIKGLFVGVGDANTGRVLIQAFTAQQILTRHRIAFILDGETFRQVTEPTFTLDSKLVAIAENGALKFKSFHYLKRLFVLEDVYKEATDQQIETFCGHAAFVVADVNVVKANANQVVRKLIHAVHTSNVMDHSPAQDIQAKAASLGLEIELDNGRIVMPTDKKQLKALLRFLDESIYEGPLSARRLVSTSKRPL